MAWKPAPAPLFEHTTSALYASNDGKLEAHPERQTVPPGWVVVDTTDRHVELFTLRREIADAFIAGYDYRERLNREILTSSQDAEEIAAKLGD